jgi:hypothetical protein
MIWSPLDGDSVPAGHLKVSGVAWNDGVVRIEGVELSIDDGGNWQQAQVSTSSSPYGWHLWESTVKLPSGRQEIWARAIDAAGRTQPLDGSIHWNPSGYEWSGVDKVKISVS